MAATLTNDFSYNAASVSEDSPETAAAEINDDEMDARAEELVPERVQQMVLPAFTLHASHHIQMDVLFSTASMMNSARIHDKCTLKKFWEQKIEKHVERTGNEDSRMKTSALSKLREEWIQRLQIRNQLLTESMREEQLRKAKRVQAILRA